MIQEYFQNKVQLLANEYYNYLMMSFKIIKAISSVCDVKLASDKLTTFELFFVENKD